MDAVLVDHGRHSHHHVLETESVDIAAGRPCEGLAAHGALDHLHSLIGWALERGATAQLDDVAAALSSHVLDLGPALCRQGKVSEGLAVDEGLAGENSHLLAVATVGVSLRYLVLLHAELLSQLLLQTCAVEGSK